MQNDNNVRNLVIDVSNFLKSEEVFSYNLSASEKLVLVHLASYAGPSSKGIYPGYTRIGRFIERSDRQVSRLIDSLVKKNLLKKIPFPGKKDHFLLIIPSSTPDAGVVLPVDNSPKSLYKNIPTPDTGDADPRHQCHTTPDTSVRHRTTKRTTKGTREHALRKNRAAPLSEFLSEIKNQNLEAPYTKTENKSFIVFSNRANKKNDLPSPTVKIFIPNEENKKLAVDYQVDLKQEIESFTVRCKYKKTQKAFADWLLHAKHYKSKNNKAVEEKGRYAPLPEITPPRESVLFDENHPAWEEEQKFKADIQRGIELERQRQDALSAEEKAEERRCWQESLKKSRERKTTRTPFTHSTGD